MSIWWTYAGPLFVVALMSTTGTGPMLRTALAILGNWIANYAYIWATGDFTPWYWFIFTDAISAGVVLYQPAQRVQAVIGWTYMVQIIMHVLYSISPSNMAQYSYWQLLTVIAFVQLVLLGGWIGGYRYRRYRRSHPRHLDGDELESVA